MRLIANKPCSFGGRQFYIGDEIPSDLVADVRAQEKMGVITTANDMKGVSGVESDALFTQEQVEKMVAEAVSEAGSLTDRTMIILVKDDSTEQQTEVLVTQEEIQQVFSIMQMNATDGAEAITEVKSENVLILLHATDSRKTIKDAAKKQADNIFSTSDSPNESTGGNETTDTNTEGADT